MADDLTNDIKTNAQGPREGMVDGVRAVNHRLTDMIEADRYLKSEEAAASKGLGVRIGRIVPPGTITP